MGGSPIASIHNGGCSGTCSLHFGRRGGRPEGPVRSVRRRRWRPGVGVQKASGDGVGGQKVSFEAFDSEGGNPGWGPRRLRRALCEPERSLEGFDGLCASLGGGPKASTRSVRALEVARRLRRMLCEPGRWSEGFDAVCGGAPVLSEGFGEEVGLAEDVSKASVRRWGSQKMCRRLWGRSWLPGCVGVWWLLQRKNGSIYSGSIPQIELSQSGEVSNGRNSSRGAGLRTCFRTMWRRRIYDARGPLRW